MVCYWPVSSPLTPGQSSAAGNAAPSISSLSGSAPSQHFRKEPHSIVAELTAVAGLSHF